MTKKDNTTIKVKQVRSLSGIREIHKKVRINMSLW